MRVRTFSRVAVLAAAIPLAPSLALAQASGGGNSSTLGTGVTTQGTTGGGMVGAQPALGGNATHMPLGNSAATAPNNSAGTDAPGGTAATQAPR